MLPHSQLCWMASIWFVQLQRHISESSYLFGTNLTFHRFVQLPVFLPRLSQVQLSGIDKCLFGYYNRLKHEQDENKALAKNAILEGHP